MQTSQTWRYPTLRNTFSSLTHPQKTQKSCFFSTDKMQKISRINPASPKTMGSSTKSLQKTKLLEKERKLQKWALFANSSSSQLLSYSLLFSFFRVNMPACLGLGHNFLSVKSITWVTVNQLSNLSNPCTTHYRKKTSVYRGGFSDLKNNYACIWPK